MRGLVDFSNPIDNRLYTYFRIIFADDIVCTINFPHSTTAFEHHPQLYDAKYNNSYKTRSGDNYC